MINVCDINGMKPLLAEHGFHFSNASWVPQQIAEDSGVDRQTGVLEIGPGIGPLTQQLALRAGKVCAVELDTRLAPILKQTVGEFDNLEIIWSDVLKQDIPALVAEKFSGLRPAACSRRKLLSASPPNPAVPTIAPSPSSASITLSRRFSLMCRPTALCLSPK